MSTPDSLYTVTHPRHQFSKVSALECLVYKVTILRTFGSYVYTGVISCYHYVRLRRKSDGEREGGRNCRRKKGRESESEGGGERDETQRAREREESDQRACARESELERASLCAGYVLDPPLWSSSY